MKYIVLLFCILTIVSAFSSRKFKPYQKRWKAFRKEYGKVYDTRKELNLRKTNFMDNVRSIDEHNVKYNKGAVTYTTQINFFADMTIDEYMKYTGLHNPKFYINISYKKMKTSSNLCSSGNTTLCLKSLPDSINWTAEGAVTRVKNQGVCPANWAFASIGAIEAYHFLVTGKLLNLSVQQLLDCSKLFGNIGCKGGVDANSYDYVIDIGGVATDSSYPYTQKNGYCAYKASLSATKGSKMIGYTILTKNDENQLQMATAKGPVSVIIDVKYGMFRFYKSGVYSSPECSTTDLNHAALVVGYGTQKEGDYWLIKNSWGQKWGDNGYIKLARNKDNACGIASRAIVPTVVAA